MEDIKDLYIRDMESTLSELATILGSPQKDSDKLLAQARNIVREVQELRISVRTKF